MIRNPCRNCRHACHPRISTGDGFGLERRHAEHVAAQIIRAGPARFAAILNWAVFEGLCLHRHYRPIWAPSLRPLGASAEAAAVAAAHGVLSSTFQTMGVALDGGSGASSLVHVPNGEAKKTALRLARPLPPR